MHLKGLTGVAWTSSASGHALLQLVAPLPTVICMSHRPRNDSGGRPFRLQPCPCPPASRAPSGHMCPCPLFLVHIFATFRKLRFQVRMRVFFLYRIPNRQQDILPSFHRRGEPTFLLAMLHRYEVSGFSKEILPCRSSSTHNCNICCYPGN